MRVLVVEDERVLADRIAEGLRLQGMAVDVAYDGAAALEKAWVEPYEVIVLDRGLPRVSGDVVCRTLVEQRSTAKVLMLTAARDINDRVEGLNIGADDYLGKPFAFAELVARIRALARRAPAQTKVVIECGDVAVDTVRRVVTRGGLPLDLSRKELAVLEVLLTSGGEIVSPETLLAQVWDENADPFSNAVRVTIGRLRAKLGEPAIVETVVGAGYRLRRP